MSWMTEAQLAEGIKGLKEQSAARGLPELYGQGKSEWRLMKALKTRLEFVEYTDKISDKRRNKLAIVWNSHEMTLGQAIDRILQGIVTVHSWVDGCVDHMFCAGNDGVYYLKRNMEECDRHFGAAVADEYARKDPHNIIRPDYHTKQIQAAIRQTGKDVLAHTIERNDDFIAVLKQHRFSWSREDEYWKREAQDEGTAASCLVKTALDLLDAGFEVVAADAEQHKIISEAYENRPCSRWIKAAAGDSQNVYIIYDANDSASNELWAELRKMGARWDSGACAYIIGKDAAEATMAFAQKYLFRISEQAKKILERTP